MDSSSVSPTPIIVLCRDLLFGSKISAAAQSTGIAVKFVRDPAKLQDEAQSHRMIVDLTQQGFPEAAAEWKSKSNGQVIGFAGHADTQTIALAKELGLDQVLSRGEFAARVADILRS